MWREVAVLLIGSVCLGACVQSAPFGGVEPRIEEVLLEVDGDRPDSPATINVEVHLSAETDSPRARLSDATLVSLPVSEDSEELYLSVGVVDDDMEVTSIALMAGDETTVTLRNIATTNEALTPWCDRPAALGVGFESEGMSSLDWVEVAVSCR